MAAFLPRLVLVVVLLDLEHGLHRFSVVVGASVLQRLAGTHGRVLFSCMGYSWNGQSCARSIFNFDMARTES